MSVSILKAFWLTAFFFYTCLKLLHSSACEFHIYLHFGSITPVSRWVSNPSHLQGFDCIWASLSLVSSSLALLDPEGNAPSHRYNHHKVKVFLNTIISRWATWSAPGPASHRSHLSFPSHLRRSVTPSIPPPSGVVVHAVAPFNFPNS